MGGQQPASPQSEGDSGSGRRVWNLRVICCICLLGGASSHAATLWQHGLLWDYRGVPLFTAVFWTSLTFLDPLAALLLLVRPRAGLLATLGIIAVDVAHNLWFGARYRIPFNWMIASQCAFLVFVSAIFPHGWRSLTPRPAGGRAPPHAAPPAGGP
jgi:hypothetical protein